MLKKHLVILIIFLLLTGCYNINNRHRVNIHYSEISSIIVKGQTTKRQILDALGHPNNHRFDSNNGNEEWTYFLRSSKDQRSNFRPTDDGGKQLDILFDGDGIVISYAIHENQGRTMHFIGSYDRNLVV